MNNENEERLISTKQLKRCSREKRQQQRHKKQGESDGFDSSLSYELPLKPLNRQKLSDRQKKQTKRKNKVAVTVSNTTASDSSSTCSAWSSDSETSLSSPRRHQTEMSSGRPISNQYVALDCEMVGVGLGGKRSALARVTVIDWSGNVIIDEYVRPESEVTDYRTFVSGITKEQLDRYARLDLHQCRHIVSNILRNKILIGHALENDLRALNIHHHPWHQIRDTAKYEPFMKMRYPNDGTLWPRKLKELSQERLGREIQITDKPHSPYEDALAALDLYKSVQRTWDKAVEYRIMMAFEMERQNQHLYFMQKQHENLYLMQKQQQLVPIHSCNYRHQQQVGYGPSISHTSASICGNNGMYVPPVQTLHL